MYNPGTKAKSKRISMNQRLDVLIEEIEKQMKRESAWRIVFPTETEGHFTANACITKTSPERAILHAPW